MPKDQINRLQLIKSYKKAHPTTQYSEDEVAFILGILPEYMKKARKALCGIRYHIASRKVFYLKRDIEEWCQQHPYFKGSGYYCQN